MKEKEGGKMREKLKELTFIDWIIILILIFGMLAYIYKPSSELTYRGNQMYNAIKAHEKLAEKGFIVEARIKGKMLVDNSDFDETGILLSSTAGRFRFKLKKDSRIILIGGELAYSEDVAAKQIEIKPLDKYLIITFTEAKEGRFSELLSELERMKKKYNAEHLYVTGEIAFDRELKETEKQKLRNLINSMYLSDSVYMPTRESSRGFSLYFVKTELSEIEKLESFADNMEEAMISTSMLRLHFGYEKTSEESIKTLADKMQKELGEEIHIAKAEI